MQIKKSYLQNSKNQGSFRYLCSTTKCQKTSFEEKKGCDSRIFLPCQVTFHV